jgi:DNA repair protein RadC
MAKADSTTIRAEEDKAIYRAIRILNKRLRKPGEAMRSPSALRQYFRLQFADEEREIFYVLFLDAQNRLIASEPIFTGTLTQTSVYPREVVKRALYHNAAAVVFAHNHPSGIPEPSYADQTLTQVLKSSLALIDVRALDHFIVGGKCVMSFAEHGLM